MLSVEERTDDVVVLCLNYTGISEERITAPSVGTTRDGMSTLHLEPVVESTPVARHWVAAHLRDLPAEVTGCAALLTSELVTNAVLHAATPLCITLHILPDRIRVDVADGNPVVPVHQGVRPGRGHRSGPDPVQHPGLELGRASGRRRQDRLVRAPGRLPGGTGERLRRQFPLRPDRASRRPSLHGDAERLAGSVGPACWGSRWRSCRSRVRNTRPCSASSG